MLGGERIDGLQAIYCRTYHIIKHTRTHACTYIHTCMHTYIHTILIHFTDSDTITFFSVPAVFFMLVFAQQL